MHNPSSISLLTRACKVLQLQRNTRCIFQKAVEQCVVCIRTLELLHLECLQLFIHTNNLENGFAG
jgi:hypothetical protein